MYKVACPIAIFSGGGGGAGGFYYGGGNRLFSRGKILLPENCIVIFFRGEILVAENHSRFTGGKGGKMGI